MTIEEAITITLAEWHAEPFGWADANCDFSVGAYVERLTGIDPSSFWRPLCGSEEDARRLMDQAGGNSVLIRRGMTSIGAKPVGQPERGDVIAAGIRAMQLPGIFLGPFAAFRSPRGVFRTRRFNLIEAWRCV